jgi:hypothetical protein
MSRGLRVRCGVARALLANLEGDRRLSESRRQSAVILDLFTRCRGSLTEQELTDAMEWIMQIRFAPDDQQALLSAVTPESRDKARGAMQTFFPLNLDLFTQTEWDEMLDPNPQPTMIWDINMQQLATLKCIWPCENTTKGCSSLWIVLTQRDPNRYTHKKVQHEFFKKEYKRFVRGMKVPPSERITRLPSSVAQLRERHPRLYESAFTRHPPVPCPNELRERVTVVDSLFKPRGGGGAAESRLATQNAVPQLPQSDPNMMMQMMSSMMFSAMQSFQQNDDLRLQYMQPGQARAGDPKAIEVWGGRLPSDNLRPAASLNELLSVRAQQEREEEAHRHEAVPPPPLGDAPKDGETVVREAQAPAPAPQGALVVGKATLAATLGAPSVTQVLEALAERDEARKDEKNAAEKLRKLEEKINKEGEAKDKKEAEAPNKKQTDIVQKNEEKEGTENEDTAADAKRRRLHAKTHDPEATVLVSTPKKNIPVSKPTPVKQDKDKLPSWSFECSRDQCLARTGSFSLSPLHDDGRGHIISFRSDVCFQNLRYASLYINCVRTIGLNYCFFFLSNSMLLATSVR